MRSKGSRGRASATARTSPSSGPSAAPSCPNVLLGRAAVSFKDADGWRENITLSRKADSYTDRSVPRQAAVAAGSCGERGLQVLLFEHRSAAVPVRLECAELRDASAGRRPAGCSPRTSAAGATARRRCFLACLRRLPRSSAIRTTPASRSRATFPASTIGRSRRFPEDRLADRDRHGHLGHLVRQARSGRTLETFPYFPFLQSSADPTAGTRDDALVLPPALFGPLATINATTGQNRFHDAWSQEVRLTSPDKQRLRWILGGYFVATDLDVMISVNRDLGGGDVVQETDPNIGGVNPTAPGTSGSSRRSRRSFTVPTRGGAAGVPVRSAAAGGLRGEPRQPEPESGRALVQLRPQRQQRVCGLRPDELRPERARRSCRLRSATTGTIGKLNIMAPQSCPAGVPLPERSRGRRARGGVRCVAAESDDSLEADGRARGLRRLCAGVPERRVQPQWRRRRRRGAPIRWRAGHAGRCAGFLGPGRHARRRVWLQVESARAARRRSTPPASIRASTMRSRSSSWRRSTPRSSGISTRRGPAASKPTSSWLPVQRAAARFRGRAARYRDPEELVARDRRHRHHRQEAAVQPGVDHQRRHQLFAAGARGMAGLRAIRLRAPRSHGVRS